ncbi:hypothetical protein BDN72DRAFT_781179 [Pluteus cervinus]|uniref:Uncharacterized protein n=1 Tax=Pluteus cervinus TaxID=181527 RepID=A0ACD3A0P1_9AGAR|nr:hypothetical protein BDN72DRAFT_781179 [Pluteus cervinus]
MEGEEEGEDPVVVIDYDAVGNPILIVVDVSGAHRLPVRYCRCSNAEEQEFQLLRMGLFPTSYQEVKTIFTFAVLDDYLIDNQECKTSGYHYFAKVKRRTSSAFPHRTPNRYRELIRLSRQWRMLKEYKWNGFAHTKETPGPGKLAVMCPTCPQPGINLPENWKNDENQLLYMRSFVMDGNFTASHLKQKHPEDDVWLGSGTSIMTARERYYEHLEIAPDDRNTNDCNASKALNARISQSGTNITGIGAMACARHGFFAPCSCVDFQKGEKYVHTWILSYKE